MLESKEIKWRERWLVVVLSQVFRIPQATDRCLVRVFDVVCLVMYDLADFVGSLSVWDEDVGTLHLGVMQMSSWTSRRTLVDSTLSLSWEIVLTVFLAAFPSVPWM